MKHRLRSLVSLLCLSVFTIAQAPTRANCQMALQGVFARTCSMGCCQKRSPAASCPMIKAEAPRDVLSTAVAPWTPALQALAFHPVTISLDIAAPQRVMAIVAATLYDPPASRPSHARAPPSLLA